MRKTNLEAKFTKSSENFSKLEGKTQNLRRNSKFEKKLKHSHKKLKVSAFPLIYSPKIGRKKPAFKALTLAAENSEKRTRHFDVSFLSAIFCIPISCRAVH